MSGTIEELQAKLARLEERKSNLTAKLERKEKRQKDKDRKLRTSTLIKMGIAVNTLIGNLNAALRNDKFSEEEKKAIRKVITTFMNRLFETYSEKEIGKMIKSYDEKHPENIEKTQDYFKVFVVAREIVNAKKS